MNRPLRRAASVAMMTLWVAGFSTSRAAAAEPPGSENLTASQGPLHLKATQPEVTYLLKVGRRDLLPHFMVYPGAGPPVSQITIHSYQLLCDAPCDVALPPGEYLFGLRQGDSRILDSRRILVRGDETLTGTWVSRRAPRLLMAWGGLAAALAGAIVATKSVQDCSSTGCSESHPHLWLGASLALVGVGLIVTSQLSFLEDRAEIEVGR
jgi:hypothetical protein